MNEELVRLLAEELRAGLASIIGYSRTLELRARRLTEEERAEFANRISAHAEHLARLADYLHTAARVREIPPRQWTDPSATVRRVVTQLADVVDAHRVRVELHLASSLRAATSEETLQQIVVSLLIAALQASTDGSRLRVATRHDRDRAVIEILATDARPDAIGRLETLTRQGAWTAATALGPGQELALSLVRPLVESHGGTLLLDLVADGVSLRVEMPTPPQAHEPSASPAGADPSSMTPGNPGSSTTICS